MRVVRIKDYVELTGVTIKSTLVSSVCLGSFSIKRVSAKLIVIKLQLFTQEYSRKLCTSPTVDFKPGNYCRKQMFGVEMCLQSLGILILSFPFLVVFFSLCFLIG